MQHPEVSAFDQVPDEMLLYIFKTLDGPTLLALRRVSPRFEILVRDLLKFNFAISEMEQALKNKKDELREQAGLLEMLTLAQSPTYPRYIPAVLSDINKTHNIYFLFPKFRKVFGNMASLLVALSEKLEKDDSKNEYGSLRSEMEALMLKIKPEAVNN